MKRFQDPRWFLTVIFLLTLIGCGGQQAVERGIKPEVMADALYEVLAADRAVYATHVVTRLQDQENVIKATEHWKEDKTLPLPAQMFRMGAEKIQEKNLNFSYGLLSKWPINKKNKPVTEVEIQGVDQVLANNGSANYYGTEKLGGQNYFTAVYPDVAVAEACINCHNDHVDSPRNDFKLNDVMGAIVIRIKTD